MYVVVVVVGATGAVAQQMEPHSLVRRLSIFILFLSCHGCSSQAGERVIRRPGANTDKQWQTLLADRRHKRIEFRTRGGWDTRTDHFNFYEERLTSVIWYV